MAMWCGSRRVTVASIRRRRFTVFPSCGAVAIVCGHLEAAELPVPLSLTPTQQAAVARAFAPILVFHPLENYFPISSMFRVGGASVPVAGGDANGPPQPSLRAELESWPVRVAAYGRLSPAE